MPQSKQFNDSNSEVKTKKFVSGNATIRSSGHKLRPSKTRDKDPGPKFEIGKKLPNCLRGKVIISYDTKAHDLRGEIKRILRQESISKIIGWWEDDEAFENGLEYFSVMEKSLIKASSKVAQASLADIVQNDTRFLEVFDTFVQSFILQALKQRLIECGVIANENTETTFYYQRPPTLRIQPGPSSQHVPKHCDSEYGHQDGEINFWIPLTDRNLTQTDLHVESAPGKHDYTPLGVLFGQLASFHGTTLRHYVPPNTTHFTRVSLDFRVGIKGYFDYKWRMRGTVLDHTRKELVL